MTADALPLVAPLSVTEFMAVINLTDDSKTEAAEQHLRAAVRTVEGRVGALNPRAVTVALPNGHGGRYWHKTDPVLSVTTVDDSTPTGVTVSAIGVLEGLSSDATSVVLQVGREPVPDDLVLAVFFLGSHLWEMQRGRAGRGGGREGVFARPEEAVPAGFAIPRRALELMADHLLPGFA